MSGSFFRKCGLAGLGFSACLVGATPEPKGDPRGTLDAFCTAEAHGDEAGVFGMMGLSVRRQNEIRKRHPGEPMSVQDMISSTSFTCGPVLVIHAFRVVGFAVHGSEATAEVEYRLAGAFEGGSEGGCAQRYFPREGSLIRETLRLRYGNGSQGMGWRREGWYVQDPAIPKVSVEALLRLCRAESDKYRSIAADLRARGRAVPSNISDGLKHYEAKVHVLESIKPDAADCAAS